MIFTDARSRDGHRFRQGMNLQLAPIPSPTDTFMSSDHAVQAPWNEPAAPSQTSVTDVTTEEYATFGLHSLDNLPSQCKSLYVPPVLKVYLQGNVSI